MATESVSVKPEWPMAILDAVRMLMNRGYLHEPEEVEVIRPGHDSVFPCARGGQVGSLKLTQLQWAARKGKFWFEWYVGSFLKLKLNRGVLRREVIFDPTKQNPWAFVREIDDTFQ